MVVTTQWIGLLVALAIAVLRGEPVPGARDLVWSVVAGLCGVIGVSSLYRGLAVGRMGVVAPTTGILAALIPVAVGFATQGVPSWLTVAGIALALVAVALVTRAPGHRPDMPSGAAWALLAGTAIGGFNVCIGQLSDAGQFGPLAVMRAVQVVALLAVIAALRQPWRVGRADLGRLSAVGVLDMTGNVAFIAAAQSGALAVAAVLSSLYPVTTVLLALALLRERVTRSHAAGIAITGLAIALIAAGTSA